MTCFFDVGCYVLLTENKLVGILKPIDPTEPLQPRCMRNMVGLLLCWRVIRLREIKQFSTIDEQLNILKERGLIIDDIDEAHRVLSYISYYRLSAYTLTLRCNDQFYEDVHFSDVLQIYDFDMEMRAALMHLLESIEVSMRTYIGYHHAKAFGALGYHDEKTFEDKARFKKFEEDYKKSIKEYGEKEAFVKHHNDVYGGQFPIWVLVEILTLGTLSRLFKNLTPELKSEICSTHYGLINESYIGNWLQGCTILRNICAHRGRLFNRHIPFSIKLSNKDKQLFKNKDIEIDKANKQLFVYLIVIRKMVPNNKVWDTFADKLIELVKKYPFVRLDYYGFTDDWKKVLGIKDNRKESGARHH